MALEMFFLELKKRYKKEDSFKYAFWGVSSVADKLYDYIQVEYPNAVLVKVIDTFRKIEYKGCDTELPDVLNKHDDFITIVTTINCAASAKPFFDGIGKKQEEYICVANEMMEERPK